MSDASERMPLPLPAEIWASVTQITENFGGAFWRPRPFPAGKHHAEGVPYTRADVADAHKRQRDEAYRALVNIRDGGRTATEQSAASRRAQAALDAISQMSIPSQELRGARGDDQ